MLALPRIPICLSILMVACWSVSTLAQAPQPDSQPATAKKLTYNQNTFYIPFNAGTAITPDLSAKEVLLFVSGDKGASWQLYQRQAPAAQRFAFRAAIDGEYWFAVRTLFGDDEANDLPPLQGVEPELKVQIDSEEPRLDMSAALINPKTAGLIWGISDPNLDPNTLKMEYRTSAVGIWQPIIPTTIKNVENGYSGEVSWQLTQPATTIEIRASVKDSAGNTAKLHDTIGANNPVAVAPPALAPTEPASNALGAGAFGALRTATRPPHAAGAGAPATKTSPDTVSTQVVGQDTPAQLPVAPTLPVGGPASRKDVFLPAERAPQPTVAHRHDPGWKSTSPATKPSPIRVDTVPSAPIIENNTMQPVAGVLNPPVANEMFTSVDKKARSVRQPQAETTAHRQVAPAPTNTPAPTQAHMSASKQFHLDYDVEATEIDKVARVSLWVTTDNGQNWNLYGEDPDRISPFLVDVDADGVYGFRMLIENSDGIAPRPPASGDPADVWIHVDSIKPTARIVSARFGRNAHLGQLQIYWDAADENLVDRPISLLYSDQPNGPWRIVGEQLANTGRYDWDVKETVPADFYLQLEVRDKAGNITRDSLRDPMSRDGLAPRGVIRDVRPADSTGPSSILPSTVPSDPLILPSQTQSPIAPPVGDKPSQVPASLTLP